MTMKPSQPEHDRDVRMTRPKQQVSKRLKGLEGQLREARKKTERLISVRDRSSAELKLRLEKAGFSDTVIRREVDDALSAGLVDDERFMRLYIEGKKRCGWGQNRIEAELKRFGIEIRLSEGYPESFFDEEEEIKRAQECLCSFRSSAKDQWAAGYRRLISRGFSREIAQKVLRTLTI